MKFTISVKRTATFKCFGSDFWISNPPFLISYFTSGEKYRPRLAFFVSVLMLAPITQQLKWAIAITSVIKSILVILLSFSAHWQIAYPLEINSAQSLEIKVFSWNVRARYNLTGLKNDNPIIDKQYKAGLFISSYHLFVSKFIVFNYIQ